MPPVVLLLSVVLEPEQTVEDPVIAGMLGVVSTVSVANAILVQPKPLVTLYNIEDVPAARPVTTPEELIVATDVLLLNQVPPLVAFDNVVVNPIHSCNVPVIGPTVGAGFTVTVMVVLAVVEPLDTSITNTSLPEYPDVGVYVQPEGVTGLPVEVSTLLARDKVPCVGLVVGAHVSVNPDVGSEIVSRVLMAVAPEFSHTVSV